MAILRNMKVAQKLLLLIIPTVLITIVFLVLLSYQTHHISNMEKEAYYDTVYKDSALILNADRDIYQASIAERTLVLSGSTLDGEAKEALLTDYSENYNQVIDRVNEAMQNLQKNATLYKEFKEKENQVTLSDLNDSFTSGMQEWLAAYDPSTGKGDYDQKNVIFEVTRNDLNTMTDLLDQYGAYITDKTEKEISNSIIMLIILISIVVIIISLITGYVIMYLKKNIQMITRDMNSLSENDLSFQPHSTRSKDELGILANAISTLVYSLRGIITDLSQTSNKLSNSSKSMQSSSEEVTSSMNEIAKTAGDIAEGALNQAEDVQQLVQELQKLGEAIDTSSQSSKRLSNSSELIRKAINEGIDTVNQLEEITKKNQCAFESIFTTIDATSMNAGKIGEASSMIASITNQTKLLALNASIEAARAGESGKGFAVVADEIRRLSEQSSHSTMMIDQMLGELMDDIKKASEQSDQVREAVKIQTSSVGETKDKYTEIASAINDIRGEIGTLDTASGKMVQSKVAVSDFGANVSAVSEENAASTEETSAASEEVLASMTTIHQIGQEIDELVTDMKELIDKFKIE
jgi:methyl-accepting chemotaxis protein